MKKSEVREIRIVVHEGIDELNLMRDLSSIIDGPTYLDQFPCPMEGGTPRSYRLDSHNDWFACLGRKCESMLSSELPLEHDTLRIWHRYGGKPLESIRPWLEYRFLARKKTHPTKTRESISFYGTPQTINRLRKYARTAGAVEANGDSVTEEEVSPAISTNPLGVYLKGLRYREKLTQVQLSEKTDIPRRHISEMESGKRTIGKATARKLAEVLKTEYRMFL